MTSVPITLIGVANEGDGYGCQSVCLVTNFTFRLHVEEQAREVLAQWQAFMRTAPDELSCNAFFWTVPPDPNIAAAVHGQRVLGLAGMYAGPGEEGERTF